ncbi:MAG TPA: hypothetical protein VKR06_46250 [Ktedonosporobacter sp.]|nr:hypothetical protein [Ktedonosporobacter sp.]
MALSEVMLGIEYLYAALSVDSALTALVPGGVWRGLADPGTATPFIVIAHQAGTDSIAFGAVRALTSMLYQAKVVGPANNSADLATAAARLDTLITTAVPIGISGGLIKSCYREQPLLVDETVTGEKWANIGGLYRIRVSIA